MQLNALFPQFNKLQLKHGEPTLDPVYGAGCIENPKACLIFMNPTARNISCRKNWEGLKAPWIGTKYVWKMLSQLGLFPTETVNEIYKIKGTDWSESFANEVYSTVANNQLYITNLAKCTQIDARPLKNNVFKDYLDLMYKEIGLINPQRIITFGNQVSSIFLQRVISVSKARKKCFDFEINQSNFKTYPVYYPVGQGMRNINMAIEDLQFIMSNTV